MGTLPNNRRSAGNYVDDADGDPPKERDGSWGDDQDSNDLRSVRIPRPILVPRFSGVPALPCCGGDCRGRRVRGFDPQYWCAALKQNANVSLNIIDGYPVTRQPR